MKKQWMMMAALALALPLTMAAQQPDQSQAATAGAAEEAARSVQQEPHHGGPRAIGAPTMELGVEHTHAADSEENDTIANYDHYLEMRRQAMAAEIAAEKRREKEREAKSDAFRDEMHREFPDLFY